MDSFMKLAGKRVVVLGGTSGFGLATAKAAAAEGAEVIVVSSRKESVEEAVKALPERLAGHVADMGDEDAVKSLFEKIGAFDHLVYTAGDTLSLMTMGEMDMAKARRFFEIRYWGMLMAATYGSRKMNKGGSITLTNGIVGMRPWKGWAVPASVSGAVESLTRALAVELAPLRVNAVCAGVVNTNLWSGMSDGERKGFFENTANTLPVGRVGEPEDIAGAYLYLMKQGYMTGQMMVVDGGSVLV